MSEQRLQKILSRAGIASRRKAEELIANGQVTVDGKRVTELGVKVDERKQQIRVDGKLVLAEHFHYVLLHKPRGVMCTTRDPEGRTTVLEYVRDVPVRVLPVGRLDYHTSGVLLLSNDGDFVQALAHAKQRADKVYVAKVRGVVDDAQLERWREPIVIDGKKTRPAQVRRLRVEGDKTWIEVTLTEGRNRQIHRLGEAVGNIVLRLARIAFAGINHEGLRPGQWRYLTREELTALKRDHGVPLKVRATEIMPKTAPRVRPPRRGSAGAGKRAKATPERERESSRRRETRR
jgi:23S rRNA pseudouridine2605 synthase